MTNITISYVDPETDRPVTKTIRIHSDQLAHFMEFAEELGVETEGY